MYKPPNKQAMFSPTGERVYWPSGTDRALCNCARCGVELASSQASSDVAGRVNGRPYCRYCLAIVQKNQVVKR